MFRSFCCTGKPRYNEHGYSENPVITRTFLGARFFFHRPPCILFSYNEIGYSEISAITRQIPSPRIRKKKRNQPRYYEHSVTATPRSEGNATTAHSQAIFFAPLNTDHTHTARIHTHTQPHMHTCPHYVRAVLSLPEPYLYTASSGYCMPP